MPVPLLDLKSQYATIRDDVLRGVSEVLDSQVCIGGPHVAELEKQIAHLCDCQYGIGVSSGTDAILASLMSLNIGPGDEVITTPFTFFATAGCIARVGAKPVFVDIEPEAYNIDPNKITAAITKKTKAIIPVHLYGQSALMGPIQSIAGEHDLAVIEDVAQAIGSHYKGKKTGSFGNTGCLSFYPTKNLGGVGDGGMIVTNDTSLAEKMKIMRDHGQRPTYYYKFVGGNFRLDALQAAVLLVKVKHLKTWTEKRQSKAAYYSTKFKDSAVVTPYIHPDCDSVYHQYVIRIQNRDHVMKQLRDKSVGCGVYYPVPLHLQECFSYLGYKAGDFPEAEKAAGEVLALPVYPELTSDMQDIVVNAVLEAMG